MKPLKNYSEAQALEIINRVSGQLGKKFAFGYYAVDDLKQIGWMLANKAIEDGSYDESRPLENFLRVYLRNRFINLKRDKYFRAAMPCDACPLYDKLCKQTTNQCMGFTDKMECEKYAKWHLLNHTKKNLIDGVNIGDVDDEGETQMKTESFAEGNAEKNELSEYIDERLPAEMRADYLKIITNYGAKPSHQAKVSAARQEAIRHMVQKLMGEYYGRPT
jgi:hypothetical protein